MTLRDTPSHLASTGLAPTDLVPLSPPPVPEPAPSVGPRAAPDEVWAEVRADYLAGLTARECCRRHGVGLSALRERAAREGWRRVDQPWTRGARLDPDDEGAQLEARVDGDLDRVELDELAYVAWRRMMRAVMRGDAGEALRWRRVRLAMDEEAAEQVRLVEQEERYRLYGRDPDPDSPDSTDSVFESGQSVTSPCAQARGEDRSRSDQEGAARSEGAEHELADTAPPPPGGLAGASSAGPPRRPSATGR